MVKIAGVVEKVSRYTLAKRKTKLKNLRDEGNEWLVDAEINGKLAEVSMDRETGQFEVRECEGDLNGAETSAIKRTFKSLLETIRKGGTWRD